MLPESVDRLPPTAFVVDDDDSIRTLWRWLMEANGIAVQTFATASEFIAAYREGSPGCLVLDLRLPGMSGLELQQHLKREGVELPVVFVTAHGDIPTAVEALKGGAIDYIEKPFGYRRMLAIIDNAFRRDAEIRERHRRRELVESRLATLTERERELLHRVIDGKQNKVIAAELDISTKTVEFHRSKMMEKMGVESVAELVQLTLGFSLMDARPPGG